MAKDDYDVGYRKPPRHSRFKPGTSGNPSGKRRNKPSPLEILDSILGEFVNVTDDKGLRKITTVEALYRRLMTLALKGDKAGIKILTSYIERRAAIGGDLAPPIIVNISAKDGDL